MPLSGVSEFHAHEPSRQLVVLLHAYRLDPESLRFARKAVHEALPDADILIPSLPTSTLSMEDPNALVQTVLAKLDRYWRERQGREDGKAYEHIVFVGHSIGALVARKAYIVACGENADAPFEPEFSGSQPREWAETVERIILLAGMNRGWSVSHHQSPVHQIGWWLGSIWSEFVRLARGRRPLILAVIRGAPFITQLRVQWLAMRLHAPRKQVGSATTIQLLGSVDDVVSPEDNVDLMTGGDFIYLDVAESNHGNVIVMDQSKEGIERATIFKQALTTAPGELRSEQVQPDDVAPVIHGIRDEGHWTHKIARRVTELGREVGKTFATETSTYGYFAMLPFILPAYRRAKMEWLMDQFVESKALYPNAEFSFVGHSNGTYLLTKALHEYPCCRFKHVVLAGSVVHWQYNWAELLQSDPDPRVKAVLNYVATADWVVAFFPKALQIMRLQDLGSAGHDGFIAKNRSERLPERLHQVRYVRGGHGAALNEDNWEAIAHFVVHGVPAEPPGQPLAAQRSPLVVAPGRVAPAVWVSLFALAGAGGYGILRQRWADWLKTSVFIGYLWLIWKIVTRV